MVQFPLCRGCQAPVDPTTDGIEWCPACEIRWPLASANAAVNVKRRRWILQKRLTAWIRRTLALSLFFALVGVLVLDRVTQLREGAYTRPPHIALLEAELDFPLAKGADVWAAFPNINRGLTLRTPDADRFEFTVDDGVALAATERWGSLPAMRLAYMKTLVLTYAEMSGSAPERVVLVFAAQPKGTLEWRRTKASEFQAFAAKDMMELPGRAWFAEKDGVRLRP